MLGGSALVMILGVSGRYCAGKNQVVRLLTDRGYREIDVDAVGHEVLDDCKDQLVGVFSQDILDEHGGIDRRVLGEIVFGNPDKRVALESVVHPVMRDRIAEITRSSPKQKIVINAALLFPMKLDRLCDSVLWVTAPWVTRYLRALRRDQLGAISTARRLLSQAHLDPQFSSSNVDIHTVDNSGTRSDLAAELSRILETDIDPAVGYTGWREKGDGAT